MGNTEGLRRRALEHGDIPDLMALVEEAGWNQSERDWDRMLTLGTGLGLSDENGRVIASAVALPYDGRIGWIGMVLVAKPWRQRGLATELMETCVAHLAADGLIPGLDATPAGEKVYERMGFCGTMTLSRWRREARSAAGSAMPQVLPEDLGWITALDARAFGARRDGLIASLAAGCGALANRETAFLFIRPGRTATQLGPLCATDDTRAAELLDLASGTLEGALLIDVPDDQAGLPAQLTDLGFTRERPFRRMFHGDPDAIGDPALLFAAAGPELG